MKDVKALFFLQQEMHEILFSRIVVPTTTSKQVWTMVQKEIQGLHGCSQSNFRL